MVACENSFVGPNYDIRPATLADIDAIAEFQTACWREAYRGLVPDAYLDSVSVDVRAVRWRERLTSGARQIAIGWSSTEIAGVISWGPAAEGDPALELKSLYVGAQYRGSGLAAMLTQTALGDRPAQLWVFEQNPRAQAFYRKLGFAPDGTSKVDPDTGVPEIRMVRRGPGS
jgi:ribosomal protein S18 acetylase RimI-like enzyme